MIHQELITFTTMYHPELEPVRTKSSSGRTKPDFCQFIRLNETGFLPDFCQFDAKNEPAGFQPDRTNFESGRNGPDGKKPVPFQLWYHQYGEIDPTESFRIHEYPLFPPSQIVGYVTLLTFLNILG
jgi:hypothetical protein